MLTADRQLAAREIQRIQEGLEQAAGPNWPAAPEELPANAPEILASGIRQVQAALSRPMPADAKFLLKQSVGFMGRLRQELTLNCRDGDNSDRPKGYLLTAEQRYQYRAAAGNLEAARQGLARNLYELLEPHCGVLDSSAPPPEKGNRAAGGEFAEGLYVEYQRRPGHKPGGFWRKADLRSNPTL